MNRLVPQRLREVRLAHVPKLTLPEIARQCGLSVSTVRSWQYGQYSPTEENLAKLADVLGVTVESISEPVPVCPACGHVLTTTKDTDS